MAQGGRQAALQRLQDKRQEACNLLAPVYNCFTEGFDTTDLHAARVLMEELEQRGFGKRLYRHRGAFFGKHFLEDSNPPPGWRGYDHTED